jgi:hypothetical protein
VPSNQALATCARQSLVTTHSGIHWLLCLALILIRSARAHDDFVDGGADHYSQAELTDARTILRALYNASACL